jgi:hypothetical protein
VIQGDLDPAFEQEIKNQRAISAIPGRQLLSFDTTKLPHESVGVHSNGRDRATLTMSWRDSAKGTTSASFGFLRIVYERNTKILVLVTSVDLDNGRKTETAMSTFLSIFP